MAIRPWQHVIDVVNGYLKLGIYNQEKEEVFESFNFGPHEENEINVEVLTQKFISNWHSCDSRVILDKNENLPESKILRLDSTKAKKILIWEPLMDIDCTIKETALWYEKFYSERDIYDFTIKQINLWVM